LWKELIGVDAGGLRPTDKGLSVVFYQVLLLGLLALPVLEGGPEDQIHHEHLVGDDDGEQEDCVVLGLLLQVVDAVQQQVAVVDDFREEDDLDGQELPPLGLGVAGQRVIERGEHDLDCREAAAGVGNIEVAEVALRQFVLAGESAKVEDDGGDLQRVGDEEGDLRSQEEDPPDAVNPALPHYLHEEADHHAADAQRLEQSHLISDSHVVPGEVV
jgi:hypothetical protein